jgi:poly-gamma-glutamate synthesis protein (capsule biosynthesis protein)
MKRNLISALGIFLLGSLTNLNDISADTSSVKNKVVISAAGDVTLGYRFNDVFGYVERKEGKDSAFVYPFSQVKRYFENSISIVNLEGPLTDSNDKMPKKFNFKGSTEYAKCLSRASIEIVNLANNHSFDYGKKGLEQTLAALEKEKVLYCGAGRNLEEARQSRIIEEQGVKVAFLGYADVGNGFRASKEAGVAPCVEDYIVQDIKKARLEADIVVVSFHFGEERMKYPTGRQKQMARKAIDSGANIVIGHHPHVLQGIERYHHGIIFYSLGNFCFGGNQDPRDKDSMIAQVIVSKDSIESFYVVPVKISSQNLFQPYVVEGEEKSRIYSKIKDRSRAFKTEIKLEK